MRNAVDRSSTQAAIDALTSKCNGSMRKRIAERGPILADAAFVRAFVPYVLASGVLDVGESGFTAVAESIAYERFGLAADEKLLDTLGDEAIATNDRLPAVVEVLVSMPHTFLLAGLMAGYLLGLAVGQQLGPNAFDGPSCGARGAA